MNEPTIQTIQLNNRPYPYREGATISSLMTEINYDFPGIIVKINEILIEDETWHETYISAGDNVEIIHVFGGG